MITARFYKDGQGRLRGFQIMGHAGFADFGNDIVCASVSSAVMLTANTVTDAFKLDAKVKVLKDEILLKLGEDNDGNGDKLVLGLLTQMYLLSEEFPGCIKIENVTTKC